MFTGRRVDFLDGGKLTLQINRHRYYDYYTGRWLTEDPFGMDPSSGNWNLYEPLRQYKHGLCLYEFAASNPAKSGDPVGLFTEFICCTRCQERALRADESRAQDDITSLKLKIQCAIGADTGSYPWFTGFKLNNSLNILKKASGKLSSATAKCEMGCSAGVAAWVFTWPFGNTVHVCPPYWGCKESTQSAVLVHEGTHIGGATNDAAYFWQNHNPPHDVLLWGIIGWDIIASTYDTWILTTFCVPGYDCPATVWHNPWRDGGTECPCN